MRKLRIHVLYTWPLLAWFVPCLGAVPLPDFILYGVLYDESQEPINQGELHAKVERTGSEDLDLVGGWLSSGKTTFYAFRVPLQTEDGGGEFASVGDRITDISLDGRKVEDFSQMIPDYGTAVRRDLSIAGGPLPDLFVRGDTNDDGKKNIADAIFLLSYLFGGGPEPHCQKSGDSNADGRLNIADVIRILGFLFGGAEPLPPPFEICGTDPTPNGLTCNYFEHCPGKKPKGKRSKNIKSHKSANNSPPIFAPKTPPQPSCLTAFPFKKDIRPGLSLNQPVRLVDSIDVNPECVFFGPSGEKRFVTIKNGSTTDHLVTIEAPDGLDIGFSEFYLPCGCFFHLEIIPKEGFEAGNIVLRFSGDGEITIPCKRRSSAGVSGSIYFEPLLLGLGEEKASPLEVLCSIPFEFNRLELEFRSPSELQIAEVFPNPDLPLSLSHVREGDLVRVEIESEGLLRLPSGTCLGGLEVRPTAGCNPTTAELEVVRAAAWNRKTRRNPFCEAAQVNLRAPASDLNRDGNFDLGSDIPLLASGFKALESDLPFSSLLFDTDLNGRFDRKDLEALLAAVLGVEREKPEIRRAESFILKPCFPAPGLRPLLSFTLEPRSLTRLQVALSSGIDPSWLVLDMKNESGVKLASTESKDFLTAGQANEVLRICFLNLLGRPLFQNEGARVSLVFLNESETRAELEFLGGFWGNRSGDIPLSEEYISFSLTDAPLSVPFVRGDTNGDGVVDFEDSSLLSSYLFGRTLDLLCPDASDLDDNGRLDLSDLVIQLRQTLSGTLPCRCEFDLTFDDLNECSSSFCE